ncbi:MAG: Ubiquinone biosynthesis O-methyltransferase [Dehalococcoidia bacterium]|nr:Ubiquinone biosynthesis O-methyltransferase [Bacillota bacterium]MBT9142014.1 Ubiquinone biosynthesis O-methyltransferase [Bacillota bacterium]
MKLNARKYNKEIQEFQSVILNPTLSDKMKPLFYDYFKTIVTTKDGSRNYFLQQAAIFDLLEAKEKDILNIGCGFGLGLICFALLGCRKAYGIDISGEMTEGFRTLLREFPQLNIKAEKGDFLLTDYSSSSYDVVILQEAISHIRDTSLLLDKIQHILRPGGILYISDGNNDLFLLSRIQSRREWKRAEHGPIREHMARHGREVDKLCFFEARISILHQLCPSLDDKTLKLIARKTQGMYGEQITKAAEEFMTTGKICQKASFPYRNPYTGEFPELGFNPLKLTKDLQGRGFRCRFTAPPWAYAGVPPGTPYAKVFIARVLSPILRKFPSILPPFVTPSFHIVAIKDLV